MATETSAMYSVSDIEFQALISHLRGGTVHHQFFSTQARRIYTAITDYEKQYGANPPYSYVEDLCGRSVAGVDFHTFDFINAALREDWLGMQIANEVDHISNVNETDSSGAYNAIIQFVERVEKLSLETSQGKTLLYSNWRQRLGVVQNEDGEDVEIELSPPSQIRLCGTGCPLIDEETSGIYREDFVIVIGNTNQGKSWFARKLALNFAIKEKKRVLFLVFEETPDYAVNILDALTTNVDTQSYINRTIDAQTRVMMTEKFSQLEIEGYGDVIFPNTSLLAQPTPTEIGKMMKDFNADIVIIDQLSHIMRSNDHAEVGLLARDLKMLARRQNGAVICVAQSVRFPRSIWEVENECVAVSYDIARYADLGFYVGQNFETLQPGQKLIKLFRSRRGRTNIIFRFDWELGRAFIEEVGIVSDTEYPDHPNNRRRGNTRESNGQNGRGGNSGGVAAYNPNVVSFTWGRV